MELMFQPFKKCFQFSGRARRKEFWLFYLLYILGYMIGMFIVSNSLYANDVFIIVFLLFMFGLIIPAYTVTARRLHDIDRTAWWVLIYWIPFGFLIIFILCCQEGTKGENQYGPDPKGLTEEV